MQTRHWDDDNQLLDDLGDAIHAVGPLEGVISAGRAAFSWRTIDEELAALVFDSDTDRRSRVRTGDAPRLIVFATESVTIELEINPTVLIGQVIPPGPGEVQVLTLQGVSGNGVVDAVGCFAVHVAQRGPLRLRYEVDGQAIMTGWFPWPA